MPALNFNRDILDTLITAIVVVNDKLEVEHMNASAEDMLQTSLSHATGLPLNDLILKADRLLHQLQHALNDGQPFTERETTIHLPDNHSCNVDLSASLLDITSNNPRVVLEIQPLNRLQRINKDDESLARQETARRLIRGLAHEVKNPLGGIRGAAQLLERELPDPDLQEYTSVIISEADRLKELVNRMLGPQQKLQLQPVNILEVFERVMQLINNELPDMITWRRDYDPSLPALDADESQIIQAVLNIVRNACQAMETTDDPRITLRSRVARQFTIGSTRHRQVMRIEITDNGPGIAPELQERIFFPMISGRAEGTGLGLAITQNIIAEHKGTIQVSSRPGNTCFSIYLPFPPPNKKR